MPSADPAAMAQALLAHAEARPATLGQGRLICIDGLAGAGKSTLARYLRQARPEAVVLATDDLMAGWRGVLELGERIEPLLRTLAADRAGRWHQWDWIGDCWGQWHQVEPTPLLVLEGVGSAAASYHDLITTLAWLEAPRDQRLARGLARDGEALRAQWLQFIDVDEPALHQREGTRQRADLIWSTG